MSETSLTCPHQKNDIGGSFGGPPSYRGKGKAIDIGGHSLGCGADVIVPVMSTTKSAYGGNGESSCAVRRRLFDEPLQTGDQGVEMEESGRAEPEPIEGGTITAPTRVAQPSSLYTWTQFQDSLHDLLNDESTELVLFAGDAPPVPHILADGVMFRQQLWDFQGSKILCAPDFATNCLGSAYTYNMVKHVPWKRICKVEGCWYGVRDVRRLTKSGVHSYGSVTNDFLPMVVSTVIAFHPFLFRKCVRSVSEAAIGRSWCECRSGSYRVAWLCAAAVNPDHWPVLIFCLMS
ncbi:hypothetical protein DY000_02026970 [Brassica cretica]|uniref:Uncharacterized protein n=1 Tax=Brassica cretica TaxID=69181 RepID=A0ABQ7E225_BRACR|nr:hypothetical protein DY000_02026970 [Brassica cretica]